MLPSNRSGESYVSRFEGPICKSWRDDWNRYAVSARCSAIGASFSKYYGSLLCAIQSEDVKTGFSQKDKPRRSLFRRKSPEIGNC
jgi:hypothetical protein